MEKYQEIERSIIKKYRKEIWRPFVKAVNEYELIQENDNIMVCISGGKDSFLLAKCIQELQRHGKIKFNAHYVVMDPGYNDYNRDFILDNAKILNVPIEMFQSDIFDVVAKIDDGSHGTTGEPSRQWPVFHHGAVALLWRLVQPPPGQSGEEYE